MKRVLTAVPKQNIRTAPPEVSVVMPVYNARPYLDEAVESILSQTFSNFEFIILDDGSTDGSTARLREWASRDDRIILLEGKENLGPVASSERVARAASAAIVVRMDADDVSLPDRIEAQVKVLRDHPDVGVVGGLFEVIDAEGRTIRGPEPWRLVRNSVVPPFGHGPMTYRREVFDAAGGYRPECEFWEDQDLLIRMAGVARVMSVPRQMYKVRQSPTSTRVVSRQERLERAVDLFYRCIARLESGQNYDDLLHGKPSSAKVDPRVFVSLGSVLLWAGLRPRMAKRLLQRAELGLNFRSVASLVWTIWAQANPSSLRVFFRGLLFMKNAVARAAVQPDEPVSWTPPSIVTAHRSDGSENVAPAVRQAAKTSARFSPGPAASSERQAQATSGHEHRSYPKGAEPIAGGSVRA